MKSIIYIFSISLLLSSCSNGPIKKTLRDVDITSKKQTNSAVFIKPKSDEEIRKAYEEYLKHATSDSSLRLTAINRLAELEFELGNKQQQEAEALKKDNIDEATEDKLYFDRIDKTIELLNNSLRDYPKSKGNDKTLYQLAKAYDMKGDSGSTKKALSRLVKNYPKSPYYVEAKFRLGEIYFSHRDFLSAEDAYTDVITAKKNGVFYEKAVYKRGWARFKQDFYEVALDDFLVAVTYHGFSDYEELTQHELQQFNEYFRAIGLSFSYLGGAEPIHRFFKANSDFKYLYYTYAYLSDIYRKQSRFSDAVDTLTYFAKTYPKSNNIPESYIKMIDIWKESGFRNKLIASVDEFYNKYNPHSQYWVKTNPNRKIYKNVHASMEKYLLLMAKHFHHEYQSKRKKGNFEKADLWYKRYLTHYKAFARKNNFFYLYGELLASNNNYEQALFNYENSAYDSDIILNKDAAYETIVLTDKMIQQEKYKDFKDDLLNKHIKYATLYTRLYPNDKKSNKIIAHAAELAFASKQHSKAIEISELLSNSQESKASINANIIKAHSYFKLEQYASAEAAYQNLLDSDRLGPDTKSKIEDKLALSIYKQAEIEKEKKNFKLATWHFTRIASVTPDSSISATGMYDAIAMAMTAKKWPEAISFMKNFKSLYPDHKLSNEVSKKLSVAYLNSNQSIEAAKEYEKMSGFEQDSKLRVAALWKAAELYEEKGETESAIKTYVNITKKYKHPYPQYLEAMQKLTDIYLARKDDKNTLLWRNKIIQADKRVAKKQKTDRTKFIASNASLMLAKSKHDEFIHQELTLPLKTSLRKKKLAMQKAVEFYGRASIYGIPETATEATHSIAEIYNTFSKDLLKSERPKGLKADELDQYQILLEDKAFPFEEKAIEFFETNLARVNNGVYNDWIKKSHDRLKELFPVRYKREPRIDDYISVLH